MDKELLNNLVSGAIWRAEQLESAGEGNLSEAWLEVSKWEEELAKLLPASTSEGRIARRGAVRAALKAGDTARAKKLASAFRSEPGVPASLKRSLSEILPAASPQLVGTP